MCSLDIVIHPRCYLPHFIQHYKKVFELVLTGDKIEKTKNTVIQRKYKKYSIFIKNADVDKIIFKVIQFFRNFLKLIKALSLRQVSSVWNSSIRNRVGGVQFYLDHASKYG